MKRFHNKLFLSVILAAVAFAAEIALVVIVMDSRLLPGKYILLFALSLTALTALGVFLALGVKKLGLVGNVLLAILLGFSLTLSIFVSMGVQALRNDVFVKLPVEEDIVCILVKKDDPAQKVEDLGAYTFGIMEETDLEKSQGMLQILTEQYGFDCKVKTYADLSIMLTELLAGTEIQAAIFDPVYMFLTSDVMEEMDPQSKLKPVFYVDAEDLPAQTEPTTEPTTEPPTEPTTEPTTEPITEPTEPRDEVAPFAMYITGIDGNYSLSAKSNSDVNIIVVVNPKEKQVMLLNTPRDYYIQMPVKGELQPDKLTHCGCYGIDVSMGALENLYGIDLKYYFKVNFRGFKKIIDALGGITVYSEHSYIKGNGFKIVEGYNKLDGKGALVFARERYHVEGGDETRGKNQMKIIMAVFEKAMSPALLMNYTGVLKSLEGSFATDLPYDTVASLVRNVIEEGNDWEIFTHSVSGKSTKKWLYSLSKWVPEYAVNDTMVPNKAQVDAASKLMEAMLRGEKVQAPQ